MMVIRSRENMLPAGWSEKGDDVYCKQQFNNFAMWCQNRNREKVSNIMSILTLGKRSGKYQQVFRTVSIAMTIVLMNDKYQYYNQRQLDRLWKSQRSTKRFVFVTSWESTMDPADHQVGEILKSLSQKKFQFKKLPKLKVVFRLALSVRDMKPCVNCLRPLPAQIATAVRHEMEARDSYLITHQMSWNIDIFDFVSRWFGIFWTRPNATTFRGTQPIPTRTTHIASDRFRQRHLLCWWRFCICALINSIFTFFFAGGIVWAACRRAQRNCRHGLGHSRHFANRVIDLFCELFVKYFFLSLPLSWAIAQRH